MLRTAEEIYQDVTLKELGGNPLGTRTEIILKAINEAQKESAIEFFKWHRNNYSSQPNDEELKERYEIFSQQKEK